MCECFSINLMKYAIEKTVCILKEKIVQLDEN